MLSVIIPACNEENYLEATIGAVRKQNHPECEVIVISDGSTDNTDKIASKLADKFLRLEKRQGPAAAKNAGARIAKGDAFVFLDADTLVTEGVLNEIDSMKKEDLVGTCRIQPSKSELKHKLFMIVKNYVVCPFGVSNGIVFCTRGTFEKFGPYPEVKKREEGLFLRKVGKRGSFVILRKYVVSSVRRFEKLGYARVVLYWVREALKPSDEHYPLVR